MKNSDENIPEIIKIKETAKGLRFMCKICGAAESS